MFNYEAFRDLCYRHGESETKVASKCGITAAAVSGWRRGSQPSDRNVQKLAEYFNVDPSVFYGEPDVLDDPKNDDLILGFMEEMLAKNNLTDDEKLLLDIFRLLPDDRKQELLVCAMQIKTK